MLGFDHSEELHTDTDGGGAYKGSVSASRMTSPSYTILFLF
jgi:hypothetical protein